MGDLAPPCREALQSTLLRLDPVLVELGQATERGVGGRTVRERAEALYVEHDPIDLARHHARHERPRHPGGAHAAAGAALQDSGDRGVVADRPFDHVAVVQVADPGVRIGGVPALDVAAGDEGQLALELDLDLEYRGLVLAPRLLDRHAAVDDEQRHRRHLALALVGADSRAPDVTDQLETARALERHGPAGPEWHLDGDLAWLALPTPSAVHVLGIGLRPPGSSPGDSRPSARWRAATACPPRPAR
jgi:hypothetical protein